MLLTELKEKLSTKNTEVKIKTLKELYSSEIESGPGLFEVLTNLLTHSDEDVRFLSFDLALEKTRDQFKTQGDRLIPIFFMILKDHDAIIDDRISRALNIIGEKSIDPLIEGVKDDNLLLKKHCIQILSNHQYLKSRAKDIIETIASELNHSEEEVSFTALKSLLEIFRVKENYENLRIDFRTIYDNMVSLAKAYQKKEIAIGNERMIDWGTHYLKEIEEDLHFLKLKKDEAIHNLIEGAEKFQDELKFLIENPTIDEVKLKSFNSVFSNKDEYMDFRMRSLNIILHKINLFVKKLETYDSLDNQHKISWLKDIINITHDKFYEYASGDNIYTNVIEPDVYNLLQKNIEILKGLIHRLELE